MCQKCYEFLVLSDIAAVGYLACHPVCTEQCRFVAAADAGGGFLSFVSVAFILPWHLPSKVYWILWVQKLAFIQKAQEILNFWVLLYPTVCSILSIASELAIWTHLRSCQHGADFSGGFYNMFASVHIKVFLQDACL